MQGEGHAGKVVVMEKTVNILGETAKEQWLTAIRIYSMAIEANINEGMMQCHLMPEREPTECFETAIKVLGDFTEEMVRLVEGVFE